MLGVAVRHQGAFEIELFRVVEENRVFAVPRIGADCWKLVAGCNVVAQKVPAVFIARYLEVCVVRYEYIGAAVRTNPANLRVWGVCSVAEIELARVASVLSVIVVFWEVLVW